MLVAINHTAAEITLSFFVGKHHIIAMQHSPTAAA